MQRTSMLVSGMLSTVAVVMMSAVPSFAEVVTYPAPPGLTTSPDYTMTVNGTPVSVQKVGPAGDASMVSFANFSCSGSLTIEITASQAINTFVIRPKVRGIVGVKSGNKLTFTVPGPQKLVINVNSLHDLNIFANPLEVNPPKQGDPGVTYYGPGAASPGTITLQSNQTIYLAGGAIVTARISGSNVQNVKVMGRGILAGTVRVSGARHLLFDGIITYNPPSNGSVWTNTLTRCDSSAYRNVKVLSFPVPWSTDGINPCSCRYFAIDDCFIRSGDDCLSIKTMDANAPTDSITITNCIMAGWNSNDGVNTLESVSQVVQNIFVKNCDIIRSAGGSPSGHAAINWTVDGLSTIQNIRMEDVRCEDQCENNLQIQVTNGAIWSRSTPGHIKGIYMKNVSWELAHSMRIFGFSATNMVEDVTFDHCTVAGKPLTKPSDAGIYISTTTTRNIRFIDSVTKIGQSGPAPESGRNQALSLQRAANALVMRINQAGGYSLDITDLSGALVGRFAGVNAGSFALPASQIKPGAYVVRVCTDAGVVSRAVAIR